MNKIKEYCSALGIEAYYDQNTYIIIKDHKVILKGLQGDVLMGLGAIYQYKFGVRML